MGLGIGLFQPFMSFFTHLSVFYDLFFIEWMIPGDCTIFIIKIICDQTTKKPVWLTISIKYHKVVKICWRRWNCKKLLWKMRNEWLRKQLHVQIQAQQHFHASSSALLRSSSAHHPWSGLFPLSHHSMAFAFGLLTSIDGGISTVVFVITIIFLIACDVLTNMWEKALKGSTVYNLMLQKIYKEIMLMGFVSFGIAIYQVSVHSVQFTFSL